MLKSQQLCCWHNVNLSKNLSVHINRSLDRVLYWRCWRRRTNTNTQKDLGTHELFVSHERRGVFLFIGSYIDVGEDVTQTQTHKKISLHMNCLFHIRWGVYSSLSGPVSTLLKTSHKYKLIKRSRYTSSIFFIWKEGFIPHIKGEVYSSLSGPVSTLLKTSHKHKLIKRSRYTSSVCFI